MAITVQYGPIAAALGLAQKAGAGQGYNIQAQRDLQALGLQNAMQQTINSNNSNLISLAMQRDEQAQRAAATAEAAHQRQLQDQAELGLRQQQLNQQNAQFQDQQQTREEQAKSLSAQRAQETKDKAAKEAWLATLTPEQRNAALSNGAIPVAKPPVDESPNTAANDKRLREQQALEALKFAADKDVQGLNELRKNPLADPADILAAAKKAEASMAAYQKGATSITGPVNAKGFTSGPSNASPGGATSAPIDPLFSAPSVSPDGAMTVNVGGQRWTIPANAPTVTYGGVPFKKFGDGAVVSPEGVVYYLDTKGHILKRAN